MGKKVFVIFFELLFTIIFSCIANATTLPMKEFVRYDYGFKVNIPQSCQFGQTLPNSIANARGDGFTFQMSVNSVPGAKGSHQDLQLAGEIVHDMFVNVGNRIVVEKTINLNDMHDGYLIIMTRPMILPNGQTLHICTYYINVICNEKSYVISYTSRLTDADYFEETFLNSFRSLYVM